MPAGPLTANAPPSRADNAEVAPSRISSSASLPTNGLETRTGRPYGKRGPVSSAHSGAKHERVGNAASTLVSLTAARERTAAALRSGRADPEQPSTAPRGLAFRGPLRGRPRCPGPPSAGWSEPTPTQERQRMQVKMNFSPQGRDRRPGDTRPAGSEATHHSHPEVPHVCFT